MRAILAIDQGTTGSTCLVVGEDGAILGRAYSEFTQHFPRPGWVEHDASEIWEVTLRVAREAMAAVDRESALSLYLFGAGTLARIDYRGGDQDAALARLDELATIQRQRYPDNADMRLTVHTNRAEVLLAQGEFGAALDGERGAQLMDKAR